MNTDELARARDDAANIPDAKIVRWHTALDNHEPVPRAEATGYGVRYVHPSTGSEGFKIYNSAGIKDAHKASLILDDGETAVPYYCVGWKDDEYTLYQPFPTNPDGAVGPDNGRPIDYSTWILGPRKTYHFKITELED